MNQKLITILLLFWAMVSIIYIGYDILNKTTSNISETAYQNGMESALGIIMQQGLDKSCQPVNIFDGTTELNLINIDCLGIPAIEEQN